MSISHKERRRAAREALRNPPKKKVDAPKKKPVSRKSSKSDAPAEQVESSSEE